MDTRGTHESLDERMRRIVEAVLKEKEKEMRRKVVNYAGKEFNERIKDQIESTFDVVLGELIIHPRGRISPPTTVASGPVATHSRGSESIQTLGRCIFTYRPVRSVECSNTRDWHPWHNMAVEKYTKYVEFRDRGF